MAYTTDKKTNDLDPIGIAAPEDMSFVGQQIAGTQAETSTTEEINRVTRAGAGLSSDGTYNQDAASTYIDDAYSIHEATQKLDDELLIHEADIQDLKERIVIKKVTLTSNDILNNLNGNLQVVEANSGEVVELISAFAKLNHNGVDYAGSDKIELKSQNGTTICTFPLALFTFAEDVIYKAEFHSNILLSDRDLVAYCKTNPTLGNGTIDLHITYRIVTL